MKLRTIEKSKKLIVGLAIILSLFLALPTFGVHAETSTPTNGVRNVERINEHNVVEAVAPKVTNEMLEGKIERGGSQIYGLIQTVVIYASYIGFAVGILWTMIGFGRSGRTGGLWLLLLSSVAFMLIGYGPEAVSFLGDWFRSL